MNAYLLQRLAEAAPERFAELAATVFAEWLRERATDMARTCRDWPADMPGRSEFHGKMEYVFRLADEVSPKVADESPAIVSFLPPAGPVGAIRAEGMVREWASIPADYERERRELVNRLAGENGAMRRDIARLLRHVERLTAERDAALAVARAAESFINAQRATVRAAEAEFAADGTFEAYREAHDAEVDAFGALADAVDRWRAGRGQ